MANVRVDRFVFRDERGVHQPAADFATLEAIRRVGARVQV